MYVCSFLAVSSPISVPYSVTMAHPPPDISVFCSVDPMSKQRRQLQPGPFRQPCGSGTLPWRTVQVVAAWSVRAWPHTMIPLDTWPSVACWSSTFDGQPLFSIPSSRDRRPDRNLFLVSVCALVLWIRPCYSSSLSHGPAFVATVEDLCAAVGLKLKMSRMLIRF